MRPPTPQMRSESFADGVSERARRVPTTTTRVCFRGNTVTRGTSAMVPGTDQVESSLSPADSRQPRLQRAITLTTDHLETAGIDDVDAPVSLTIQPLVFEMRQCQRYFRTRHPQHVGNKFLGQLDRV